MQHLTKRHKATMRWAITFLPILLWTVAGACTTPDLVELTEHYARGFGLDPDLMVALVWQESRFCQDAVSPKGAIGMGQLMPATAAELGVDPHDLHQNLWATARYLRERYEEWGDWVLALAAYNAGSGNVRKYGGIPPFAETQRYVKEVLDVYAALKRRRNAW
jgi:soluble lytic murein transglycosylase-like protein